MAIPSDADFTTHSPLQYRLAVGPDGDHGYEIGYWPANVDRLNPHNFFVVEAIYGQQEAATRTLVLNSQWMTGVAPKNDAKPTVLEPVAGTPHK